MLRPRRSADEVDPGPVQVQARKVHFDVAEIPLHWIPGHPVASNVVSLLNIVLPAAERGVEHRDTLLTEPERDNQMMLVWISRAADGEHLTLDL
jgi:predicted metal-dependent hydrolase